MQFKRDGRDFTVTRWRFVFICVDSATLAREGGVQEIEVLDPADLVRVWTLQPQQTRCPRRLLSNSFARF